MKLVKCSPFYNLLLLWRTTGRHGISPAFMLLAERCGRREGIDGCATNLRELCSNLVDAGSHINLFYCGGTDQILFRPSFKGMVFAKGISRIIGLRFNDYITPITVHTKVSNSKLCEFQRRLQLLRPAETKEEMSENLYKLLRFWYFAHLKDSVRHITCTGKRQFGQFGDSERDLAITSCLPEKTQKIVDDWLRINAQFSKTTLVDVFPKGYVDGGSDAKPK